MKRFFLSVLTLCLFSCAKGSARTAEEPARQELPASGPEDIGRQAHEIILNHPSFTPAQRAQMLELYKEVAGRSAELRAELGKLKGSFFRALFSKKRDDHEVKALRQKLLAANAKKMELMLGAVEKAERILAQGDTKELEKLFHELDKLHRFDAILRDTP